MNTCVISDLPPLNNSSSLRFFTILASKEGALAKKKTSSSFSLEDVEEVEEEEEEFNDEEEEIDEEEEEDDDDDETERRWMEDERITNATRIDVRELTDTLYDENTNEINLTTARSKSYLKKIQMQGGSSNQSTEEESKSCSKEVREEERTLIIFYEPAETSEEDEEEEKNTSDKDANNNDTNTNRSEKIENNARRRARRRQRNRSVFVPFYIAHVFRRCGHTGPIKVLLKEEKKKKRRGSTKEEDEEEEARRSVSSVSGIYDERIASVYDLLQNLTTQRLQVIDTRSEALFLGKVRRGAKTGPSSKNGGVDRAGHIPSSINVPHSRLRPFDNEHNIAIFEDRGVDMSAPCAVIGEQRCSSAPFVAAMLENLGLKEVFIVESGVRAWRCEDGGSYPLFNPSTDSSSKGRVLVWSVTRGRSTALERAFAQHPKIMVMHELLTEPYLKENTPDNYEKIKNGQQTLNVSSSGCSYASVMELMMTDYSSQGKPYYLCKELSCYFDEEKCTDEWLLSFHHVILVRNPSDALKSFYRVGLNNAVAESLYFDPSESGFKECQKIVERLDRIKGKYMVVDADLDLMANPEGTLKQICAFSSIAFSKNMLSWEPKELDSWKKFRGWHTDAVNSTELKAPVRSESFELADYPKEVFTAVEEAMPYYTFCIKRR